MSYQITADISSIQLGVTDTVQSVLQNVAIILGTWKGSVPLYRAFGISPEVMHRPLNVAKAMLQVEIKEAVEKFEPRAQVVSITFEADGDTLIPIVEVEINGQES